MIEIWTPGKEESIRRDDIKSREDRCARGVHNYYHCSDTGMRHCIDCMNHAEYESNEACRDMYVACRGVPK